MESTPLVVIALIAIVLQALTLILALFEPSLAYRVQEAPPEGLDSEDFLRVLGILCGAQVHRDTQVQVLANGEVFYESELEAIRAARQHVHLEAYIFQRGEIARRFIEALTDRARAGVDVRVVLDGIGSFNMWRHNFRDLLNAGGRVEWFQPLRWYTFTRWNNRTHRELLIVDGRVAFVGGAGVADHWWKPRRKQPRWRDSMFRVEGQAVLALQSSFVENWLEASGEILTDAEHFPHSQTGKGAASLVIASVPSQARGTRARTLFQILLACARRSIRITTPYFLPDRSMRREMIKAMHERNVQIEVLVPGKRADHLLTRRSSRRIYGELLKAGARIYEYQSSMLHAKTLVIDEIWSVVGSTNFDNRSFGLNDELNLAVQDRDLAARILRDFAQDRRESRLITLRDWKRRSPVERVNEWLGWLVERQQ
jgi:cardiolipin synthase A/B